MVTTPGNDCRYCNSENVFAASPVTSRNALHVAAEAQNISILRLLLNEISQRSLQDLVCIGIGLLLSFCFLSRFISKVYERDRNGRSCLDISRELADENVRQLLISFARSIKSRHENQQGKDLQCMLGRNTMANSS